MRYLRADKGYDADQLRRSLRDAGAVPVIPGRRSRKRAICYDKERYRGRYLIENAFCRLKDFRRVHTRCSPPLWRSGSKEVWALGNILDVEASHLALSKTENVSDRLVFKPVRLPLERFAFEIADGLPDLRDDRAIRSSMKAHRLDVRTDHGPLARPVLAYGLAAMDVATIHTVGPGDIIGEHGQHAVYVPRVKAIVDAFKDFDVIVHWVSPCIVRVGLSRPCDLRLSSS
jgi:transposase